MPFEPNELLNMHGQIDQDALLALVEQAAQSGGVMMGGGSYFQSPQGATFVPDAPAETSLAYGAADVDSTDTTPGATPTAVVEPSTWTTLRLLGFSGYNGLFRDEDYPERALIQAEGFYMFGAVVRWDDDAYDYSDGPREMRIQWLPPNAASNPFRFDMAHATTLPPGASRKTVQTTSGFGFLSAGSWLQIQVRHEAAGDRSISLSLTGDDSADPFANSFWIVRLGVTEAPDFPAVIDGGDDDA